ncbi:Kcnb2, partial [Symbiodinium pilosum]
GSLIEFRTMGAPTFQLTCSDRWNWDGHETFGGIARLALIHHICVKPVGGTERFDEEFNVLDRDANLTLPIVRLKSIMQEALSLLNDSPRECDDIGKHQL